MTRFNTGAYLLLRAGEQSFSVNSQKGVPCLTLYEAVVFCGPTKRR